MQLVFVRRLLVPLAVLILACPARSHADPELAPAGEQDGQDTADSPAGQQPDGSDDDGSGGWTDKYGDDQAAPSGGANGPGAANVPAPADGTQGAQPDTGFPRQFSGDGYTIFYYQPQLESWNQKEGRLVARAAVSVQTADGASTTYGVVWIAAHTTVDEQKQLVAFDNVQVTKVSFPPARGGQGTDYLALLRRLLPMNSPPIALARLQADVAIKQAAARGRDVGIKNDPPRILFSATRAILILVDGQPALRPVDGTHLMRVINTKALILRDPNDTYYMYLIDRWLQAPAINGPWTAMPNPTAEMEQAKQAAVNAQRVNLLDQAGSDARLEADFTTFPTVFVSTVPANLIQTEGIPGFELIDGTQLQFVTNTYDDIFRFTPTQQYYVLISGRWFTSPSLEIGPWSYVPAKSLPVDFAKIPAGSVAADVRASVPGTPEAQAAVVDNAIPTTAVVNRQQATLTVTYDGPPQFKPIEGTRLTYAVNASVPVIRAKSYYAADGAVWFQAESPTGPWVVATSVPDEIYGIPASSPLYYTTYLSVYDSTPEGVYVGYTPGYYGSVVSPDEVVVYGTGWDYDPWVGSYWIGPPLTYGLGAALTWDAVTGYGWGFAGDATVVPWWGPVGWGWRGPWDGRLWSLARYDSYGRWGMAARNDLSPLMTEGRLDGWRSALYAGEDGRVYRRAAQGWEYHGGDAWRRGWGGSGLERDAMSRLGFERGLFGGYHGGFAGGFRAGGGAFGTGGGAFGIGGGGFRGGAFHGGGGGRR